MEIFYGSDYNWSKWLEQSPMFLAMYLRWEYNHLNRNNFVSSSASFNQRLVAVNSWTGVWTEVPRIAWGAMKCKDRASMKIYLTFMIGNMAFLLIKIKHSLEIYLSIVSDWLRIQETTWLLKFQDIIFTHWRKSRFQWSCSISQVSWEPRQAIMGCLTALLIQIERSSKTWCLSIIILVFDSASL